MKNKRKQTVNGRKKGESAMILIRTFVAHL